LALLLLVSAGFSTAQFAREAYNWYNGLTSETVSLLNEVRLCTVFCTV
jgi:hypothetical protein